MLPNSQLLTPQRKGKKKELLACGGSIYFPPALWQRTAVDFFLRSPWPWKSPRLFKGHERLCCWQDVEGEDFDKRERNRRCSGKKLWQGCLPLLSSATALPYTSKSFSVWQRHPEENMKKLVQTDSHGCMRKTEKQWNKFLYTERVENYLIHKMHQTISFFDNPSTFLLC